MLPYELLNNLRIKILGKQKVLGKSQRRLEAEQSPAQK